MKIGAGIFSIFIALIAIFIGASGFALLFIDFQNNEPILFRFFVRIMGATLIAISLDPLKRQHDEFLSDAFVSEEL